LGLRSRGSLIDDEDRAADSSTPLGVDALEGKFMSPRASATASPDGGDGEGAVEAPGTAFDSATPEDTTFSRLPSEEDAAALKIQARQRGINDRKRIEAEKAEGNLPGQQRAVNAKPGHRESEKGVGEIVFYDGIGSKYKGDLLNGRPHGKGSYAFVNGNIYEGDFINGQFHGDGEMIFPGYGKLVSKFQDGRALGGQFYFDDGLEYEPEGWKYCVEGDRRFYHEVVDPRFGLTE
jgi:hypothetical protein